MRALRWCWRLLARALGPGTASLVLPGYGLLRGACWEWLRCHPDSRDVLARCLWQDHAFLRVVRRAGGVRAAFELVLPEGLTDDQAARFATPETPHPTAREAGAALLAVGVAVSGFLPDGVA